MYSEGKGKGKERRVVGGATSATSVEATLLNVSSYFRSTGICCSYGDGKCQCGKAAAFTPLSAAYRHDGPASWPVGVRLDGLIHTLNAWCLACKVGKRFDSSLFKASMIMHSSFPAQSSQAA